MPVHDSGISSKFQFFMSNYLIDSAVYTLIKELSLSFWVYPDDVPEICPIKLTTTSLDDVFPGLMSYYGPDRPMRMNLEVVSLSNFKSRQ